MATDSNRNPLINYNSCWHLKKNSLIYPQKGIVSLCLWKLDFWDCQGSRVTSIQVVAVGSRCLTEFHKIPVYMGNCYKVWMLDILLNVLLLQRLSETSNEGYQSAVFSCLRTMPVVETNWTGCRQERVPAGGLHWPLWSGCWRKKNQSLIFLLWWSSPSCRSHSKTE